MEHLFRDLQLEIPKSFDRIKSTSLYPRGAVLFVEGQQPRGIYVLCGGRAKLVTGNRSGKEVIARLAEAGEILGLSAAISGEPYHLTAEMIAYGQADFISRADFLKFLREYPEVCFRVVEMLSNIIHSADSQIRCLSGNHSAKEKLARVLYCWCEEFGEETPEGIRLEMPLTRQEIAQMIGSSRETVSRLLGDLARQQIISVKGSSLIVYDKPALAAIAKVY
jgi:CRP/FNR family transcriptional regulator